MSARLALLVSLVSLLGACTRDVNRDAIPEGDGWECYGALCERACPEAAALLGKPCVHHEQAHCVTALNDDDPVGFSYCAPLIQQCEEIQRGWTSGLLGDRSIRRVSRCESIR